jgi:hypothetical protein
MDSASGRGRGAQLAAQRKSIRSPDKDDWLRLERWRKLTVNPTYAAVFLNELTQSALLMFDPASLFTAHPAHPAPPGRSS